MTVKFQTLNRIAAAILCFCLLLPGGTTNGQALIFPTYTEALFAATPTQIYTLNVDMLEMAPGKQIEAMCWDLYGPSSGTNIQVRDYTGAIATAFIPTVSESQPDIVLANEMGSPGVYRLGVVYLNSSQFVNFDTYRILGAGSGTLTLQFISSTTISTNRGRFPHIDMFTDFTTLISGYPSMHKFVIAYGQVMGGGVTDVFERNGDIMNPVALSPAFAVTSGAACVYGGDVSAVFDPATGRQYAYFALANGMNLQHRQLTMNVLPATAPPIGASAITTLFASSGSAGPLLPRIESMGYNATGSGVVQWVIGSILFNPITFNSEIWEFNPNMMSGFNCTSPVFSGQSNLCVAVCAGSGRPTGNICNRNYNIGWYNLRGFMTQVIDASTGAISTGMPDYYKANMMPLTFSGSKVPIALSSCSNSGNDLFTGWWNEANRIYFKLKPGITVYRPSAPTGIANVMDGKEFSLYPNPAKNLLTVKGISKADYRVINIVGQVVAHGTIDREEYQMDISNLSSGSYSMVLSNEAENCSVKFVKQ